MAFRVAKSAYAAARYLNRNLMKLAPPKKGLVSRLRFRVVMRGHSALMTTSKACLYLGI